VVSILFVTERPEQLTGGDCCGRLHGDLHLLGCPEFFVEARKRQQALAEVERLLREAFGSWQGYFEIVWLDPQNQGYLMARLLRHVLRYRPGFRAALRTLTQWFRLPAILINGRVVCQGVLGTPWEQAQLLEVLGGLLQCHGEVAATTQGANPGLMGTARAGASRACPG
jgi:hypothetical protein